MASPVEVLDFWLGEIGPEGWYKGGDDIDSLIRDQFGDVWQAALEGGLEHWVAAPGPCLAYLVVTDQFPRNIHRNSPQAFATDAQARAAARVALEAGWDLEAPEPERQFFYMPFEHSEDPADQALGVQLMQERLASDPEMALHARAHAEIIRRYGRFPTRNAALGRVSTPEEEVYLNEGGYMAVVNSLKA